MKLETITIHLIMKSGRNLCAVGYPTFMEVGGMVQINLSSTQIKYVNCPKCITEALRLVQDEMNASEDS